MLVADYQNLILHSDASITDIVQLHLTLRDMEDSAEGMIYPVIHTYKIVDLGNGAFFPAVKFINGWRLQFPAGNFEISGGNLDCAIIQTSDTYVKHTQSAAYAVTSVGSSGPTAESIAALLLQALENSTVLAKESTSQKVLQTAQIAVALSA